MKDEGILHRIRGWVSHPDQDILRREARWFRQWARYGMVKYYFPFVIAAVFLDNRATYHFLQNPIQYSMGDFTLMWGFFLVTVLASFLIWAWLMMRRTLQPVRVERLPELLISPLNSRRLWPGLLAAPVLFSACESAAIQIGEVLSWLFYDLNVVAGSDGGPVCEVLKWTELVLTFLESLAFMVAVTSLAALLATPRGGWAVLLLSFILGLILVYGAAYLAMIVPSRLLRLLGTSMPEHLAGVDGMLMTLNSIAAGLIVFFLSLRRLRGPKTWNRLRAHAGLES